MTHKNDKQVIPIAVDVENAKIYIEHPTAKTSDLDLLYDFIQGT